MRLLKTFLVTACCMLAAQLHAQEAYFCYSTLPTTASEDEFLKLENGDLLHLRTNLVWMRCSIGQTFDGEDCLGEAQRMTWQQALETSVGYEHNDNRSWRLPNLKELSSITERACVRPAIDINAFDNTPADDFWTSTPSLLDPSRAWVVAFFNASNSIRQKDRSVFVRLVRNSLPSERDVE